MHRQLVHQFEKRKQDGRDRLHPVRREATTAQCRHKGGHPDCGSGDGFPHGSRARRWMRGICFLPVGKRAQSIAFLRTMEAVHVTQRAEQWNWWFEKEELCSRLISSRRRMTGTQSSTVAQLFSSLWVIAGMIKEEIRMRKSQGFQISILPAGGCYGKPGQRYNLVVFERRRNGKIREEMGLWSQVVVCLQFLKDLRSEMSSAQCLEDIFTYNKVILDVESLDHKEGSNKMTYSSYFRIPPYLEW